MAYDSARGVIVLFGGGDPLLGAKGDTWEWDGTSWSQKNPMPAPSARQFAGMAYDSARGVTVLFGGVGATYTNDTWEWDGTTWTQRFPGTSPPVRANCGMVYDSIRRVTVLFGGSSGADLNDTWEWDGTNWSLRSSATLPSVRISPGMAFDSSRGVTVLFGGGYLDFSIFIYVPLDDTWEWDGTNWNHRSPATKPFARYGPAMGYESGRGLTVLFGGYELSDTWEWDGTTWTQRVPGAHPSGRNYPAMAFDSRQEKGVLFGGNANGVESTDTWEWIAPGPFISQQPAPQTAGVGGSAAFSIVAGGSGPLAFQWRRNGNLLTDAGAISGSATATVNINGVAIADGGDYTCRVSNGCGAVISLAATLTVDPCKAVGSTSDCNGNGTIDSCDIAADASLDSNGNGVIDSCEAAAGGGGSASCGTCGAGAAAMMPLALVSLSALRRRRQRMRRAPRAR